MIEASQPASDGNEMLEIGSGNGFPLSMSLLVTVLRLSLSALCHRILPYFNQFVRRQSLFEDAYSESFAFSAIT